MYRECTYTECIIFWDAKKKRSATDSIDPVVVSAMASGCKRSKRPFRRRSREAGSACFSRLSSRHVASPFILTHDRAADSNAQHTHRSLIRCSTHRRASFAGIENVAAHAASPILFRLCCRSIGTLELLRLKYFN